MKFCECFCVNYFVISDSYANFFDYVANHEDGCGGGCGRGCGSLDQGIVKPLSGLELDGFSGGGLPLVLAPTQC